MHTPAGLPPEVRGEMKEIASMRRRFDYHRIGILLQRKGRIMNRSKLNRLYREEGDYRWSDDGAESGPVAHARTHADAEGGAPKCTVVYRLPIEQFRRLAHFCILAVIDDGCRQSLCLIADTSISGVRVARDLDALLRICGEPDCIVSDTVPCREILVA